MGYTAEPIIKQRVPDRYRTKDKTYIVDVAKDIK